MWGGTTRMRTGPEPSLTIGDKGRVMVVMDIRPPIRPPALERSLLASEPLPARRTSSGPRRLAWLDALRGIAALVVVFEHASYSFMPEFRQELMPQFNTGRYGILVFFLVSGYIIPASLERRGCVRTFWIGRVFRMYPLWATAVAAVLAVSFLGLADMRDFGGQSTATAAVAHAGLLQELLGTPSVLLVLWTLSYEMAFYLLVVALFTVRLHQRSAAVAVTLAVLAAVSVAAGVTLPASALSDLVGTGLLIGLASGALVVAICCASSGSPTLRVFGGVLGGILALVLVPFNGTVPLWEGLIILAVMFLGTAVHRAEKGQSSWWLAGWTAAVVVACAVASAYWNSDEAPFTRQGWIVAFLLAVLHLRCRAGVAPPADTALADLAGHDQLLGLSAAPGAAGGERRHDRPVVARQSRTRAGVLRCAPAAVRAHLSVHRGSGPGVGPEAGTPRRAVAASVRATPARREAAGTPREFT